MSNTPYRFGGPIPESVQRLKARREFWASESYAIVKRVRIEAAAKANPESWSMKRDAYGHAIGYCWKPSKPQASFEAQAARSQSMTHAPASALSHESTCIGVFNHADTRDVSLIGGVRLMANPAELALPKAVPVMDKDTLLASIETRLTQEVRGLIDSLTQFSSRAELIRKEIPEGSDFTKLVTGSLVLIGLQFAHALGKGLDKPIFFDDGAEYLRELDLCLSDFVREIDLDGRRFLAVALVDQKLCQLSCSSDGGNKC